MTSGLLVVYVPVSITTMNDLAIGTFGAVVMSAIIFATRFIETDYQSPRLRRALEWAAIWVLFITVIRMARIEAFDPISAKVYFAFFVPMLLLMVWFVADAARRGSRAVWFQIIAWSPFLILGLLRVGTMLDADASYIEAPWLFRIGAATEVVFTSLGVVDRIMAIRRERDAALIEARMLGQLSERDPLTGLMNRRAVEARFDDLHEEGFDTFALIDLDRFKEVNDRFGHQVGDAALRACAEAIRGSDTRDAIAVRLGGEEFVVLLRGRRTVERAEALRQAIPLRIAAQVPGLDRPVTASMGIVELPNTATPLMGFEELYARADQLLYEAKASGRNRLIYERLKVFNEPPAARPKPDESGQAQDTPGTKDIAA
jgi:diguanylate cyclase (GGDEF)-like protein